MPKSPEQKVMELEALVKLLEKQKTFLEQQAFVSRNKAVIFDMMIDIAEKKYQIDIRKNKEIPLIYHSNRGLQYCGNEYQKLSSQNEIQPSKTQNYDPY